MFLKNDDLNQDFKQLPTIFYCFEKQRPETLGHPELNFLSKNNKKVKKLFINLFDCGFVEVNRMVLNPCVWIGQRKSRYETKQCHKSKIVEQVERSTPL